MVAVRRAGRCEVHVFDPTLSEEQRKQVAAIHGLTLHDYGLGIKDGQVSGSRRSCSGGVHSAVAGPALDPA